MIYALVCCDIGQVSDDLTRLGERLSPWLDLASCGPASGRLALLGRSVGRQTPPNLAP